MITYLLSNFLLKKGRILGFGTPVKKYSSFVKKTFYLFEFLKIEGKCSKDYAYDKKIPNPKMVRIFDDDYYDFNE